jgi:hypothetical protein
MSTAPDNTAANPQPAGSLALPPCSALGVTPFKGYDRSRDYLDVLVVPKRTAWRAECNGVRRLWLRTEVADQDCAALMTAADAFAEYLDREVLCAEVKLERETPWEYVASVAKPSPNTNAQPTAETPGGKHSP